MHDAETDQIPPDLEETRQRLEAWRRGRLQRRGTHPGGRDVIGELRLRVLRQWCLLIPVMVLVVVLSRYTPVVLHAAEGDLDPTFGDAGKVTIDFIFSDESGDHSALDEARAVAVQPDGRIVVAGPSFSFSGDRNFLSVARTKPDGSPDLTFGNGGQVLSDFGLRLQEGAAVVIQPDGKIVVGGSGKNGSGKFLLVRYSSDGSLDSSFGDGGLVLTGFSGNRDEAVLALALQSDGKIVAAGVSGDGRDIFFALARYNVDGTLDAAFGDAGLVTTDFGARDWARDVVLQADGKIVVAGSHHVGGGQAGNDFAVARYEIDGTLDPTFGVGGFVTTDIAASSDAGNAVAIQADGKIVVAGIILGDFPSWWDFAIVRYEGTAPSHALTFFLHSRDVAGTVGGFTMDLTAAAPQLLRNPSKRRTWLSDPVVNGTLVAGATFELTLPCMGGVSLPKTVRIASTDPDGGGERPLGEAGVDFALCRSQAIAVAVETPIALAERRLKLTLTSEFPVSLPLRLGPQTFLRATSFAGTP